MQKARIAMIAVFSPGFVASCSIKPRRVGASPKRIHAVEALRTTQSAEPISVGLALVEVHDGPSRMKRMLRLEVLIQTIHSSFRHLLGNEEGGGLFMKREPVGADFIPVTHCEAVSGEEIADLLGIPIEDVLQDRYEDTERVVA